MLSLALLTAATLLGPVPVPPSQPSAPATLVAVSAASLVVETPTPGPEAPAELLEFGPNFTPGTEWSPAATCTEGSSHFVEAGECCGIALSRTLFLQEKCINGEWVGTGVTQCHLPICEEPF